MISPTALIADDEDAPRAQLLAALRGVWPELEVVTESANGVDAWDAFLEREPRVCFLDVRMPGFTGIEVAQRIGAAAHIVFVTPAGDPARAAFEAAGVDHVAKPVDATRLALVAGSVKARLAAGARPADLRELLERLAGQVRKPAPLEVIQSGTGKDQQVVPLGEVIWLEADARQTRVVHGGGELRLRSPLKELVALLDARHFQQVNRGVVVNREHVVGAQRTDEGGTVLTLRGRSERLPVGRHFQALFAEPPAG